MSIVFFDSELDWSTALSNINPAHIYLPMKMEQTVFRNIGI